MNQIAMYRGEKTPDDFKGAYIYSFKLKPKTVTLLIDLYGWEELTQITDMAPGPVYMICEKDDNEIYVQCELAWNEDFMNPDGSFICAIKKPSPEAYDFTGDNTPEMEAMHDKLKSKIMKINRVKARECVEDYINSVGE